MAEASTDPALRRRFLDAMSQAAATVNIVTTDGESGRAGVTVSAMTSVSADTPSPSLLVCVHHLSPAAEAILANRVFCVNVLRDDQSYISDTFAGRLKTEDGDKFSCAEWVPETTGAPRVVDPLVAFDCRLTDSVRVGTHHVLFGEVADLFVAQHGQPLIYANRAYGRPFKLDQGPWRTAEPLKRGDAERLALGCFHTFGPYIVPSILERLLAERPGLEVQLVEGDQRRLTGSLVAGECDLGLIYDFDLPDVLAVERLSHIQPYVLLPAGHPLAERQSLDLATLSAEPLVLLDIPPSRDYFLSLFRKQGIEARVGLRARSFEMIRGLVGHGLGYGLLATKPANAMTYDGRALVVRPLSDPIEGSDIVLAHRADRPLGPAAEACADAARAFFAAF